MHPQLKMDRLSAELDLLESELIELENSDINDNNEENLNLNHMKEIDHLRVEMEKILGSDAFNSNSGKSKI